MAFCTNPASTILSFSNIQYQLSISKNYSSGHRGLLVLVRYYLSYFQLLYLYQPGRFTNHFFQMNCLRQTCHSPSVPMLLCLTKWHNATVHFYHADLLQEVPGMNYKTSWVPTEPYQVQTGIFQQCFNSLLLSHNLFGLRYPTLGKQILYSVTSQTLSLCWYIPLQ